MNHLDVIGLKLIHFYLRHHYRIITMAVADQDILGGGLDIEGWSYVKKDVATKIADMTDRTTILRNTFPMLVRSNLQTDTQKLTVHEIVTTTLEAKSVIDIAFIGK